MNKNVFLRLFGVIFLSLPFGCFAGSGFSLFTRRLAIDRVLQIAISEACSTESKDRARDKYLRIWDGVTQRGFFLFQGQEYRDCETLLKRIQEDISPAGVRLQGALKERMRALLCGDFDCPRAVESFYKLVLQLHESCEEEKEPLRVVSTFQNTQELFEALLYLLLRKMNEHQVDVSQIHGADRLADALCVVYASGELLRAPGRKISPLTQFSRRARNVLGNVSEADVKKVLWASAGIAWVGAVAYQKLRGAPKPPPKMITIKGVQHVYVERLILRDCDVEGLLFPQEITSEREKLSCKKSTCLLPGLESYRALAHEKYEEICTSVCYNQPIVHYSSDLRRVCEYKTPEEVFAAIEQNLDILEKSTFIVPVAEFRRFAKLIDSGDERPCKDQIYDAYEFALRLRRYYKRASREFFRLLNRTVDSEADQQPKVLEYCKRMPTRDALGTDRHTCDLLHGLRRGLCYPSNREDLVRGFQASQNILEALFHILVMKIYAKTKRFYEPFAYYLAQVYDHTMFLIYRGTFYSSNECSLSPFVAT